MNKKYNIFYKAVLIGRFEISPQDLCQYTPVKDGVEKVKSEVALTNEMINGTNGWVNSRKVPFFTNKIIRAERIGEKKIITTHMDNFRMEMVED